MHTFVLTSDGLESGKKEILSDLLTRKLQASLDLLSSRSGRRSLCFWGLCTTAYVCMCRCVYFQLGSSQRRNDPTHSLLFPRGTEILSGINGESCGRKKTYRAGENMLE